MTPHACCTIVEPPTAVVRVQNYACRRIDMAVVESDPQADMRDVCALFHHSGTTFHHTGLSAIVEPLDLSKYTCIL